MYSPTTNWIEQVKYIAHEVSNSKIFVLEGIVSSVDPIPPYKVKVNLEPYDIESGWLKIGSPFVGNGYGFIFPAPEEGTAVKVIFDLGDLSNGMVVSSVYNDNVPMPNNIAYGTAGLYHKSGSSIFIAQDGTINVNTSGAVNVNAGTVNLGGSGGQPVARVGDSVNLSTGLITSGSSKINAS